MITKQYLMELIKNEECEWIEYKESYFDKDGIGEYISALSNSAAMIGEDYAYLIWGIENKTRKIKGTTFDYDIEIDNEPFKHYLARKLNPSINFVFITFTLYNKRVVCLIIPASQRIITEFDKNRYIRIGSSKELLRKYPEREIDLAVILKNGFPTIINTVSSKQDLTFVQLRNYYIDKNLSLNNEQFLRNLGFYILETNNFNNLAYILSDQNNITCRVSIFNGKSKADEQYSLNDFGRKCILITIDQILNYLESFNVITLDEKNRKLERKDIYLFDKDCLREALLNAFIHNDWNELNAPMISVFEDRIEIISYGGLPNKQTISGFLKGISKPRCIELAEIFLQLKISERSGRGVLKIVERYGKNAFQFDDVFLKVTIPFTHKKNFKDDENKNKLNKDVDSIIMDEMNKNPFITIVDLIEITNLKRTSIQKYLKKLKEEKKVERMGSKKNGYWKIIK